MFGIITRARVDDTSYYCRYEFELEILEVFKNEIKDKSVHSKQRLSLKKTGYAHIT